MATPGVLVASAIGDVGQSTLPELNRLRYVDIAPALVDYIGMRHLFSKNRIVATGSEIRWNVNTQDGSSARNVGIAATDVVNIVDGFVTANAPWRGSTVNYAMDGVEEAINEAGQNRVQDLRKQRRDMALKDLAYLMEANWWGPPVTSTDTETPYGINTWLVKNATEGFNGGAPSGFTTIGGINPTTYPGWRNYTGPYTSLTKADGVRVWRKAAYRTGFKPPIDGQNLITTGRDYEFFLNLTSITTLEELLEAQNDDLGSDFDSQYGKPVFRSQPCTYVPYLDGDSTNPIYGIDFGYTKTYVLQKWWLKETHYPNYPGQHTMAVWFIDLRYQIVFLNRRTCFVLSNGTSYPS